MNMRKESHKITTVITFMCGNRPTDVCCTVQVNNILLYKKTTKEEYVLYFSAINKPISSLSSPRVFSYDDDIIHCIVRECIHNVPGTGTKVQGLMLLV